MIQHRRAGGCIAMSQQWATNRDEALAAIGLRALGLQA